MPITKIKITPELLELLAQHRISTSTSGQQRLAIGDVIVLRQGARLENYSHILEGRLLPYALGAFSYSHSVYSTELAVGRYCSISWGMEVIAGDHPMDWASTSPFSHQPFHLKGFEAYLKDVGASTFMLHRLDDGLKPATLGNDVWLGMRVLLKRGVRVGHGAVIGAGSIVTKDVPPYAIAAGTPARIIRYRFPEEMVARLLATEWWQYGPDVIQPLDVRTPDLFLDRFAAAVAAGAKPMILPTLTSQAIITAGEPIE